MPSNFQPQEQTFVLAPSSDQPLNPALVNEEFCRYSGVIPMDWELARDPIYTPQLVQLAYQNNITITAQPNRILFTEMTANKEKGEYRAAQLVRRFAEALPNLKVQAFGFNPLGHAQLGDTKEDVRDYLNQTLLSPGAWQNVGIEPVRPQISLAYTLEERRQLNLTISEASLRSDAVVFTPVVVFSGNFSYTIEGEAAEACRASMLRALDRAQEDLDFFINLINEKFLAVTSVAPALIPAFA
ncbi:hypothetical protein NIES2135_66200 (plasmid) [Leptolyngbya boryana NIES-2135]|jgi:hypothetical protein|uniref:Uncharacterized protein n=1 Tax=Leptolyngbya boryana NIES-2135 TaxID=1973484 RepID=A0A1Z4JSU0_LEPBY|nr:MULTISPECIES: hypothetical protein [Leptolyngbya]BAY59743.1 hypothetical protein NIES2135_66200 [Leptolyngbya boryana NIES-2135]MBD2370604.1 hypothetical protein [Leptolyngbya sp. FACHB-161]MBD2377012.1 hypothetical protein [Leptolyngbya sp. FACHB-238]MBD2401380.1 hypothetical protein [Leptolyngbya sp. FACHB-239]MBD2407931.1 hypothetical protein [Leptolyngbya sp. FACHB-402]